MCDLNIGAIAGIKKYPWQLKSHKMLLAVDEARKFLKGHFDAIWDGTLPPGYSIEGKGIITCEDPDTIYGDVKGIALKTSLVRLWLALNATDDSMVPSICQLTTIPDLGRDWLDTSSFVHLTPLPTSMDAAAINALKGTPYYYEEAGQSYITVIHNGYTLGGQRLEDRYPTGKRFGPEDCSSGISKLLDLPDEIIPANTWDFMYAYRMKYEAGLRASLVYQADPTWPTSPLESYLTSNLGPVLIRDLQRNIKPGQIYVYRSFEPDDAIHLTGVGGHINLVIGVRSNGTPITLGWTRIYSESMIDGFAIQDYPFRQDLPTRESMIFDINEPLLDRIRGSLARL